MKILQVFTDFIEDIEPLGDAEVGRLFRAMLKYADDDQYVPDLKGNERFTWATAKKNINNQWAEYRKICERNKRVATTRYEATPDDTKNTTRTFWCQDKDKEKKIKDKDNIREDVTNVTSKRRFVPPTLDEVTAYCTERNNAVDPETFIDFYTSKGWMVGKNAMKDWKAAVRGWEQRDRARPAKPSKPGRFDAINEAIRKELANGSRRNNGMFLTDGQPLVELSDAD